MVLPSKHEILQRAKARTMEKQVVAGLPAITPTEREMKESGAFQSARVDLMRVDQEAVSQQMSYLQEMASELKLTVLPLKDLANLKRETGYEWTNGWTHHKPTPVMKSQERERKRLEKYVRDQQEHKKMEWIRQAKKHVSSKKLKKIAIPIHFPLGFSRSISSSPAHSETLK